MRKIQFRILTLLLLVCALLQPMAAYAAQLVDVTRQCSLELEYSSDGWGFHGLEIRLYRVAEMYADGTYTLVTPFHKLPVKIHGVASQKEWQAAANTLAAYITAEQLEPTAAGTTDSAGKAAFENLQTGIWLVMGTSAETEEKIYRFENFFVFLPTPQSDGSLLYDMQAKPKQSVIPKPDKPEEVRYQVTKLWKDAGIRSERPRNVTVAILKNGICQETVVLNAENDWTYSWLAPEGNDLWTVVEKDVPEAYTVVIHTSGRNFTITNARTAPLGVPPKTGDTFAMGPWLLLMSLSGLILMALGILQNRRRQ